MSSPTSPNGPQSNKVPPKGQNEGPSIWLQLVAAFAVFLVLSAGYSFIRDYVNEQKENIPLSQIATDISAGKISTIVIEGDTITATYTDQSQKTSRKQSESSLTATLSDYQVPPDKLAGVKIEIKDESGFRFWLLTLLPIFVPALLLLGVIWYLSRQLRGGGMQAFTFGRSLARMTSPEDEVQRVTFKDVAGAKEAKIELTEIVDFLKNPKKFIQIGARIPKACYSWGHRARERLCLQGL